MTPARFIVIGCGLLGSAVARVLAELGRTVILIGPQEPVDPRSHAGVFAAHYDAGRITRILDPNPARAHLAARAIAQYGELQDASAVRFYAPVGHLAVGPAGGGSGDYLDLLATSARAERVAVDALDAARLAQRFPEFRFEPASAGLHQRGDAGYIDPRALLRAQCARLAALGGHIRHEQVRAVEPERDGVAVVTDQGRYRTDRVVMAAGAFTNTIAYPGSRLDVPVEALSILLARVDDAEAARLRHLPTLIYKPRNPGGHLYLLPPIRYPDGRWYLKIGSATPHAVLDDPRAVAQWHRGPVPEPYVSALRERLALLMPDLRVESFCAETCSCAHTPAGYPQIGHAREPRIVWCVGCNSGAKSSVEIGRIAAVLAAEDRWDSSLPPDPFAPRYALRPGAESGTTVPIDRPAQTLPERKPARGVRP